ncbi:crescent membrane and immature virion formation protein [Raccoonpox virus]|uniref:Protein OPG096 n=1 Tax=Raccoon poxvirus TaxID=10256 RepID=A0A0G3FXP7_RACVI|nr:Crescent morphogenesis [Raccoonpox virus]AKJ93718.1 Crescent morphogenesis [Raccoonpox virus]AOP31350.1 crescent membrane and immature virion formation protein [Raccoonpox virus]
MDVITNRLDEIVEQNIADEKFVDFVIHGLEHQCPVILRPLIRLFIDMLVFAIVLYIFSERLIRRNTYMLLSLASLVVALTAFYYVIL